MSNRFLWGILYFQALFINNAGTDQAMLLLAQPCLATLQFNTMIMLSTTKCRVTLGGRVTIHECIVLRIRIIAYHGYPLITYLIVF